MGAAGEQLDPSDHLSDGLTDGSANWGITIAIAAVMLLVVTVGVVALTDGAPTSVLARPGTLGAATEPDPDFAGVPELTTEPPDRSSTTSPRSSSTTPASSTSVAPSTTVVPATTVPATTTAPATTAPAPPVTNAPPTVSVTTPGPDGWVSVRSERAGFTAELPGIPTFASPQVPAPSGTVERLEYSSTTTDGATISISAVPVPLAGRPVATILDGAVAQVQRDLGGTATIAGSADVAGAPSRQFHVAVPGGRVRGVVLHRGETLVTVAMFDSRTGPWGRPTGGTADAEFDRVIASIRLD